MNIYTKQKLKELYSPDEYTLKFLQDSDKFTYFIIANIYRDNMKNRIALDIDGVNIIQ